MAASGGGAIQEGSPKAVVSDRISQAVLSTSNLLHLMHESSPSQMEPSQEKAIYMDVNSYYFIKYVEKAHLVKLPKNLWAKVSTIKNTGQVLEQLPQVISSLDAYMESSLQSAPQLKTVTQLLSHMEDSQLRYAFPTSSRGEERKNLDHEKIAEPNPSSGARDSS